MASFSQLSPPASNKRSLQDSQSQDSTPTKRRRLYHHHHAIRTRQRCAVDPVNHCQDQTLVDGQLARSLAIVLERTGFDGVTTNAFEELLGETQEYMLSFLRRVRTSMAASRRRTPLPSDFVTAMATHKAQSSSELLEHARLRPPLYMRMQPILGPDGEEAKTIDAASMLGPALGEKGVDGRRRYIPRHLPNLPSRHTWTETPILSTRETDPRVIRELATAEGLQAEEALRKLAAARKSGVLHERSAGDANTRSRADSDQKAMWEAALQVLETEDEQEQRHSDENDGLGMVMPFSGTATEARVDGDTAAPRAEAGLLVDYERKFWRRGTRGGTASVH